MISNDFPQLKIGESSPIYILNTMEFHSKKRRIVSSGCFIFYYKVKKGRYYYYSYKDYGI